MHIRFAKSSLTILGTAMLLTACGGGSSNDGSPDPSSLYDGPTEPIQITEQNADKVINVVLSHFLGATSGFVPINDVMPSGSISYEVPCAMGGVRRYTITRANTEVNTVGDRYQTEKINCEMPDYLPGTSYVTNGRIVYIVTSTDGNAKDYSVTEYVINDQETYFKVDGTPTGDSASIYGKYTATYTYKNKQPVSMRVISPAIFYGSNFQGQKSGTLMMGVDYLATCELGTDKCTYDAGVTVASTLFGGSVTVQMPKPFEVIGENYPYSGSMTITGANGTNITLTAMSDAESAEVAYDLEPPHGVPERTEIKRWDELLGFE